MRENLGSTSLSSTPHFVLAQKKENDLGVAPARSPPPSTPLPPLLQIYGEGAFEDVSASEVEMWKSKGRKTFVVFTLCAAAAE